MWNIGRSPRSFAWSVRMSGRRRFTNSYVCSRFATKFACVNITPFGRPVVPDEYGSAAKDSDASNSIDASTGLPPTAVRAARSSEKSEGADGPAGAAETNDAASPSTEIVAAVPARSTASDTVSSNGAIVSTWRAFASLIWCASSRALYSGFDVETTPPSASAAWNATGKSTQFGAWIRRVEPGPNGPSAGAVSSAAAAALTRGPKSPYVSVWPERPSTSMGRAGSTATIFSRMYSVNDLFGTSIVPCVLGYVVIAARGAAPAPRRSANRVGSAKRLRRAIGSGKIAGCRRGESLRATTYAF
mmetsp:Transcript_34689/g.107284  ORF Transcript_34689/g.107284 Transcript_34689/m.107284 type:complete len:302 (-) Transcript_34689:2381-3286(-)